MKKIIVLLVVSCLFFAVQFGCKKNDDGVQPSSPEPTPGTVVFQKVFEVPAEGNCVIQANDTGFIIAGKATFSSDADAYLMKVDSSGNCVWSKTFGGADYDTAASVIKVSDGYIMVGETKSFGDINGDVYLVKTDFNGGYVWQKNFANGTDNDSGKAIKQTSDNGNIIIGQTKLVSGDYNVYLLKIDSNGTFSWNNDFGGSGNDYGSDILAVPSGYFIAGYSGSFSTNFDVYTIITDASGNCTASNTILGLGSDSINSIIQGIDSGYVMAGETWPAAGGMNDVYLVKVDSSGNCIFAKTLGDNGSEFAKSITSDGSGYVMTGITTSYGTGNLYIVKADLTGNEVWHRNYGTGNGSSTYDVGSSILRTQDNGFVITGFTTGTPSGLLLIKTDAAGNQ